MYTIALLIQKGGSGKTTLAISLATTAAADGLTALIVDLDPQTSACNWHDRRVAANPGAQNPLCLSAQPSRLAAVLREAGEGGIDLVIIDTPAKSSDAALAAAKVADLVLVPCKPQTFDLETVKSTREIIALAGGKPALAILNDVGAVGNRHEQAKAFLQNEGLPVCPYSFGHRVCFGDAVFFGKSATEHDPRGKGAEECRNVYKYTIRIVRKLEQERKRNDGIAKNGPRQARVKTG
jgi:chromosome partitioning protein